MREEPGRRYHECGKDLPPGVCIEGNEGGKDLLEFEWELFIQHAVAPGVRTETALVIQYCPFCGLELEAAGE